MTSDSSVAAIVEKLTEVASAMLLRVFRGKTTSIHCAHLGDEWLDGKRVGQVSSCGTAWLELKDAGLIDDYDSFGGYHYCHITASGELAAESIIQKAANP